MARFRPQRGGQGRGQGFGGSGRGFGGAQRGGQQQGRRPQNPFEALFDYEDIKFESNPRTNGALYQSHHIMPEQYRGRLGFGVNSIDIEPNKLTLEIKTNDEIIRSPRIELESVPTSREDLPSEPLTLEKKGEALHIDNTFAVETVSALVVDMGKDAKGNDRGHRVGTFRQSASEIIKGASGPAGMLDDMPGHKIRQEFNEECFIVAQKGKEEVILAIDTPHETEEVQKQRIYQVRSRIIAGLTEQLQAATSRGDMMAIGLLNEMVAEATKHREVVILKPKQLPKDAQETMRTIVTEINGEKEETKGYVTINTPARQVVVAQPILLDPKEKGIDPTTIKVVDGTGANREFQWTEGDARSLATETRQMLHWTRGPKPVQTKPQGKVTLEKVREARQYTRPYAVPVSGKSLYALKA